LSGTITGTARRLKELNPNLIVVGVDPIGSILAQPEELNSAGVGTYAVEGIGYDFIPKVLDRTVVDRWIKTEDRSSFHMARRLIREEGLLCGGSSGSAMVAAIEVARTLGRGKRVVVLLPDSVRNYMSKFLSDPWMYENGFLEEYSAHQQAKNSWWGGARVADLSLSTPITVTPECTCREAIAIMSSQNFDMVPVQADHGKVLGVITEGNLTSFITQGRTRPEDPCTKAMFKQFRKVTMATKLSDLAVIFDR
jgi:cystathionine beta-synthase